jgi:hypothetical protein
MITPKIKALFQFIEYLHSNIDNFNLNNDLINELELLDKKRKKVKDKKTFKDKLKYDAVQFEIENKFKTLQGNTANLIKAKAKELNVCNFDNEPNYSFNGIETDIHQLKENFSKDDLPEIFKYKQQYIKYRTTTHKTFLSLAFFIDELDEVTKSLFDYFKETEQNEFEAFENKLIHANNLSDVFKAIRDVEDVYILLGNDEKEKNRILERKLFEKKNTILSKQISEIDKSPQPIVKQKPELKIDQIALKYAYEGLQITRENGNEIAKEYGHNSGEKLFQRFTYFSSSANRKGKPKLCTPRTLDNKIKLIESIIELLPTDKQERAKDEASILKKIYEAEYQ